MDTNKLVEAKLTQLRTQRATFKEDADLPGNMSERERETYHTTARALDYHINHITLTCHQIAKLPSLEHDMQWRDLMVGWRETLVAKLLALPAHPRTEKEMGLQQNLKLSIIAIDRGLPEGRSLTSLQLGKLMYEAGYRVDMGPNPAYNYTGVMPWYGSLPEVERRISDVEKRRAKLQATLDEALLDDETRAKRAADDDMLREVYRAMNVRMRDSVAMAIKPDGDVMTTEEMTPIQRRAFARFDPTDHAEVARTAAARAARNRPPTEIET